MTVQYHLAIRDALSSGYTVIPETGQIIGLKGESLAIRLGGKQRYPTVSLVTPNMPKHFYAVPAHKVVAFAIWGERSFTKGIHVRHLNNNTCDNRKQNLALGTPSQNEQDKPKHVRVRVAKQARARQVRPANMKLTVEQVTEIRSNAVFGPTGRARRGYVTELANRFGVSKSAVSQALKGVTHGNI